MKRTEFVMQDAASLRGIVALLAEGPATICEIVMTQNLTESMARGLVSILVAAEVVEHEVVTRVIAAQPRQVPTQRYTLSSKYIQGEVPFEAEDLAKNPKRHRETVLKRIEERQRKRAEEASRYEAYDYLRNGPPEQRFTVRRPQDVAQVAGVMAGAVKAGKSVEVSFREGV